MVIKINIWLVFSWGGGNSSSFGLYQFDVNANPAAQEALTSLGFTDQEIDQLRSHGSLDNATLSSINNKLQSALSTSSGIEIMNSLKRDYEDNVLIPGVENLLSTDLLSVD